MHRVSDRACTVGFGHSARTTLAVERAIHSINCATTCLVLAFIGGRHNGNTALAELRRYLPGVPIVGGSAAGVITTQNIGTSGFEVGLLAFHQPALAPAILVAHGLRHGARGAGRELGTELALHASQDSLVMLFYDSVATRAPLALHPASELVAGILEGLDGKRIHLMGGGLLTDLNLTGAWVLDGAAVRRHAAVALLYPPGVRGYTTIAHGCRPIGDFLTITRMHGDTVHELDDEPALDVLERMVGLPLAGDAGADLNLIVTLGRKLGDPYAPFREDLYVNRMMLSANRADGSIRLFEPDFRAGEVVQLMTRDNEIMLDTARQAAERATRHLRHGAPALFAMYADCAGRASTRTGSRREEADVLREHLGPRAAQLAPTLFGFYSGVEIAPFRGTPAALDWTGVLTIVERAA